MRDYHPLLLESVQLSRQQLEFSSRFYIFQIAPLPKGYCQKNITIRNWGKYENELVKINYDYIGEYISIMIELSNLINKTITYMG